ncbi:MAG TPA: hypothetical protein VFV49_15045 [Thermoanaerobaculia bacterium]|nr:hypothetical protein [Thermoanaerobaculia bacterium]
MRSPRIELDTVNDARPVRWWEWAGVLVCAALFLALRWPLYVRPGLLLGWHSDAALLGLMARAIAAGDYPILFWGADYLAPLTSVFAALVGSTFVDGIGPLALRLGTAIEVFAAIVFFQFGLRRAAGRRAALLATFWLTAGPAFLFKLTYAPLSAEQYFFLGAVTFWYVTRAPFDRLHRWLILGLLAGIGWWIHRGVTFVVLPSLLTILLFDRDALRARREQLAAAFAFLGGAIFGALPIVFGKLMIDQRLYIPVKTGWSLAHVESRIYETFRFDAWELLGAHGFAWSWLLGITFVALLVSAAVHFRARRTAVLAAGVLATTLAFWLLSTDAYQGAVRYVMIALPILYAFAAQELVRLWDRRSVASRALAIVGMAIVCASLYIPRYAQAQNAAAGLLEQHEHWPGGFDPRPALRDVAAGHYTVCYANVWVAHKLEWLSDTNVRFIPYRSVNRRMVDSMRLAKLPGPKCFVNLKGQVRPLTKTEEADLRLEILWHAKGWRRDAPSLE